MTNLEQEMSELIVRLTKEVHQLEAKLKEIEEGLDHADRVLDGSPYRSLATRFIRKVLDGRK